MWNVQLSGSGDTQGKLSLNNEIVPKQMAMVLPTIIMYYDVEQFCMHKVLYFVNMYMLQNTQLLVFSLIA